MRQGEEGGGGGGGRWGGDSSLLQMQEIAKIDFNKYLEVFIKKHPRRLLNSEEKCFKKKSYIESF